MAQEYFEHVTDSGERWDLIAYHFYGDATLFHHVLRANPEFTADFDTPVPLVLPKGSVLRIPVLDLQPVAPESLPVWKRP